MAEKQLNRRRLGVGDRQQAQNKLAVCPSSQKGKPHIWGALNIAQLIKRGNSPIIFSVGVASP